MIIYEPLHPDVQMPARATAQSAGYDLRAYLKGQAVKVYKNSNVDHVERIPAHDPNFVLWPGDRAMVPTGFKAQLPDGTFALVAPRGGKALKVGLTVINTPGVIDADFADEWMVLAYNASTVPLVIDHGEAIAQFVVLTFSAEDLVCVAPGVHVVQTTARTGGFGSTGV